MKRIGLREFGPAYYDMPTMLSNASVLLRVLTLNIDSSYKKRIPIIFYIITIVSATSYLYVYLVSGVWFINRCIDQGNIITTVIMISLCVSSEIGNAKLLFVFMNRSLIRDIIDECLAYDATVLPGSRISVSILEVLKRVKIRAIFFWLMIMGNGVAYVNKPLLSPGRHFMDDLYTIYGLEPIEKSPNYEIGYALIATSVWFLCYVPANVTALLIVIAGYIEAHITALSKELTHVWDEAQEDYERLNFSMLQRGTAIEATYKERVINEFVTAKLVVIIKNHSKMVNLLQKLEYALRGAIAVEFLLLTVSLIAALLGGLKRSYLGTPYAIVQVAMDCFTGQRIIDASVAFENAVYACKWEYFNSTNMKMVLFMLGNSQKTLKLSAGGLTTLSSFSLMNIVRSIYSTYTALESALK